MGTLLPLASALGLGMLAGARLYATVLAIGLLTRFHWVTLPPEWQQASVLADTRVLALAGVACLIEFIADKIPWVDSAWDSLHTFIRPIGAALLASSLFSNLEPVYQVLLFLLAGGMALAGHSAKATTRLVVNHSPEPFSNVAVSLAEDAAVAGGVYVLVKHPWVLAGLALALLVLVAWFAPRVYRSLRAEWTALRALLRSSFGEVRKPHLTAGQQRWLHEHGQEALCLFAVIATEDVQSLRSSVGTLCLTGRQAVFFSRRWGRLAVRQAGPVASIAVEPGLFLDHLVLLAGDGRKTRFDLLAGQLTDARDEATRRWPPPPDGLAGGAPPKG